MVGAIKIYIGIGVWFCMSTLLMADVPGERSPKSRTSVVGFTPTFPSPAIARTVALYLFASKVT